MRFYTLTIPAGVFVEEGYPDEAYDAATYEIVVEDTPESDQPERGRYAPWRWTASQDGTVALHGYAFTEAEAIAQARSMVLGSEES